MKYLRKKKLVLSVIFVMVSGCKQGDLGDASNENRLYLNQLHFNFVQDGSDPVDEINSDFDASSIEISAGTFVPSDFYRVSIDEKQIEVEFRDEENCAAILHLDLTKISENNYTAIPRSPTTSSDCTINLGSAADEINSILDVGAAGIPIHVEKLEDGVSLNVEDYFVENLSGDIASLNGGTLNLSVDFKYKEKPVILQKIEASFAAFFPE